MARGLTCKPLKSRVRHEGEFHSSKKTGWLKCSAFQKLAEVVEKNPKKGDSIIVSGSLDQNKWTAG